MEEMVEHIRVNLNKEIWRIDYAAGIAKYLGGNIAINNHDPGEITTVITQIVKSVI